MQIEIRNQVSLWGMPLNRGNGLPDNCFFSLMLVSRGVSEITTKMRRPLEDAPIKLIYPTRFPLMEELIGQWSTAWPCSFQEGPGHASGNIWVQPE